eukprot:3626137-Heterocapsa_arctica.AAC.1
MKTGTSVSKSHRASISWPLTATPTTMLSQDKSQVTAGRGETRRREERGRKGRARPSDQGSHPRQHDRTNQ